MIEGELLVVNRLGMHARAAARLVNLLKGFQADVWLYRANDPSRVDARSIICLIGLCATCGTRLCYSISGPDEDKTRQALLELFDSGFGESAHDLNPVR